MTAKIDFTKEAFGDIQKGATFNKQFTLKNSDGTLMNLTGYSCTMHIRKSVGSSTTVLAATSYDTNGFITLGGTTGTLQIVIPMDTTKNLPAGKFLYDLFIISSGQVSTKLFEGSVDITESITVLV